MLTLAARHQVIRKLLRDDGHVSARQLSLRFKVTAMTTWRDLQTLEDQGILQRVRGGATVDTRDGTEPEFEKKKPEAAAAKQLIAACAVREFVRPGDAIALEGGTTVAALLDYLPAAQISLLTNSLPIALRARELIPQVPVHVTGGWLSTATGNAVGPDALRTIKHARASVCFISAVGFDSERGPTETTPIEIETKRALAACAGKVVLLLDSRKFGVRSSAVTIHPRRLHALVTEQPPPRAIAEMLARHGVRIVLAGS